eukprot:UN18143
MVLTKILTRFQSGCHIYRNLDKAGISKSKKRKKICKFRKVCYFF